MGLKVDSVEREVRRFYVEDAGVKAGDRIVVAVSGGPDSSALLHLTYDLRHELAFDLHVAHFDHRLRDQSAGDAEFVRKMAVELGIPAVIEAAGTNEIARRRGRGMEDAARRVRYDFLERTRLRLGGRFVALAHNLEDQAETLLLRLFRGAGTAGAASIRPVSGALVRPVLGVSRGALLEYCRSRGVSYRTDHTNAEAIADRNRLRLRVMPELRRVWPGIDSVLARNARLFAEDASALEWAANTALESVRVPSTGGQIEIFRPALRNLQPQVIRLVLRRAAMQAGRTQPPPKARLDAVMDFCLSPRGGGRVNMGGGVEVLRGYDTALFKPERHEPARILRDVQIKPPGTVNVPGLNMAIKSRIIEDRREVESVRESFPIDAPDKAFLDYATVEEPLFVRRRRRGDRLRPLGAVGDVSLSRFLIRRRVPFWRRDATPVVAGAGGVVWLAGLEIDSRSRVTDRTRHILELRLVDTGEDTEG